MEEKKHSGEPSSYRESQSFKQNYAGTFVAERIHKQENTVNADHKRGDPEREILPMETKIFIDRCLVWLSKNHNAVTAVSTGCIFAATAIYALFAIFQWGAMRDSNKINHDAQIAGQRAWIGVDRPVNVTALNLDKSHGGKISYNVTIKNFGNSVALNIGIWAEAVGGYDMMKPALEESCKVATDFSRMGRTGINKSGIDFPQNMSEGDQFPSESWGRYFSGDIKTGKTPSPLAVVGCVVYRDQFDTERTTRFCYGGSMELGNMTAPALLYQCPIGVNDAN